MRQVYESEADIARESRFLAWANTYDSTSRVVKLPKFYPYDFAKIQTESCKILSIIEFKGRNIDLENLDTFHISARKLEELSRFSKSFDIPAYFAIATNKGLYKLDVNKPCSLFYGGRTTKTRDSLDVEIMASFSTSHLEFITSGVKF